MSGIYVFDNWYAERAVDRSFAKLLPLWEQAGWTIASARKPWFRPGMHWREIPGAEEATAIVHCPSLGDHRPLVEGLRDFEGPVCLQLYDLHNPVATARLLVENRVDLALFQHYGPELHCLRTLLPRQALRYFSDAVDEELFRPLGLPKQYDVLVYGALCERDYPYRGEIVGALRSQKSISYREHVTPYAPIGGQVLAEAINAARLVVATPSIYEYFLLKYIEAGLCGVQVVGRTPDTEVGHRFAPYCYQLPFGDRRRILSGIAFALEAAESSTGGLAAHRYRESLAEYTLQGFARRLAKLTEDLEGRV